MTMWVEEKACKVCCYAFEMQKNSSYQNITSNNTVVQDMYEILWCTLQPQQTFLGSSERYWSQHQNISQNQFLKFILLVLYKYVLQYIASYTNKVSILVYLYFSTWKYVKRLYEKETVTENINYIIKK